MQEQRQGRRTECVPLRPGSDSRTEVACTRLRPLSTDARKQPGHGHRTEPDAAQKGTCRTAFSCGRGFSRDLAYLSAPRRPPAAPAPPPPATAAPAGSAAARIARPPQPSRPRLARALFLAPRSRIGLRLRLGPSSLTVLCPSTPVWLRLRLGPSTLAWPRPLCPWQYLPSSPHPPARGRSRRSVTRPPAAPVRAPPP